MQLHATRAAAAAAAAPPRFINANLIAFGDVVAHVAPTEHERRFELMLITSAPRVLAEPTLSHAFKDANDEPIAYPVGEVVVEGHMLQWLEDTNRVLYELWDGAWAANARNAPGFEVWDGTPTVLLSVVRARSRLSPLSAAMAKHARPSSTFALAPSR
jgi:hypothetical protein